MNPTIIEDSISIAADVTVANVIVQNASLRPLLNAPYPSKLRLLACTSAVGLELTALHGSQMYAFSCAPRIATFAEDPLDVICEEAYCQAQEQMILSVKNTTGGALTLVYRLELVPMVDETWDGNPVELPPDAVVTQGLLLITTLQQDIQLLDGNAFEQHAEPSILDVFMTQSATGMLRQVFVDQDRIAPPSAISIANRIPQDPFDATVRGVEVPANRKVFLSVSNPTGGSLTARFKCKFQKLVRT